MSRLTRIVVAALDRGVTRCVPPAVRCPPRSCSPRRAHRVHRRSRCAGQYPCGGLSTARVLTGLVLGVVVYLVFVSHRVAPRCSDGPSTGVWRSALARRAALPRARIVRIVRGSGPSSPGGFDRGRRDPRHDRCHLPARSPGFGDAPDHAERRVLGLSMIAAAIAALVYVPVRSRLSEFANPRGRTGGQRAPDEACRCSAVRTCRASSPLDELLLQLAESAQDPRLTSSEVWSGTDGVLERASGPQPTAARIRLSGEDCPWCREPTSRATPGCRCGYRRLPSTRDQPVPGRVAPGELLAWWCGCEEGHAAFTDDEDERACRARPPGRPGAAQRPARLGPCRRRSTSCAIATRS